MNKIYLIVCADDFWTSTVFNHEIISLCEQNKLTWVSIMTKRGLKSQLDDVASLKKACHDKNISLWLHLIFDSSENYEASIQEQLDAFSVYFWKMPTHLDVHKDLPDEEWKTLIRAKADELWIPLRNRWELNLSQKHTDGIRLVAYKKSTIEIEEWLGNLELWKSYEIVFHPWKYDPNSDSNRNAEREGDVKMIHHLYLIADKYNIQFISQRDI